jgi:hypothetical protein
VNGTLGASTPDDEHDTFTEAFTSDAYADNGSGAVAERKPAAAPVQRPFWQDQYDPGTDRSAPRARGPEGLTQAAWPVGAMLLVVGVAVLLFHVVGEPMAIMAGSAVTALAMLVVNHYVD